MPHDDNAPDEGEDVKTTEAKAAEGNDGAKPKKAVGPHYVIASDDKPAELPADVQARLDAAKAMEDELAALKAEREEAEKAKLTEKEREAREVAKLKAEKAQLQIEAACAKAGVPDSLTEYVSAPEMAGKLMAAVEKMVAQRIKEQSKQGERINPGGTPPPTDSGKDGKTTLVELDKAYFQSAKGRKVS